MTVDHFEKRLARLTPGTKAAKVEFITVPPAPRRGPGLRIAAILVLGLGLGLAGKGLVLAQMGEPGFDRLRQNLAEGSPWQRGLAVGLHPDPVSALLARQFGLPGPEDSAANVRLNHDSDVTMIEVEPDQGGD